MDVVAVVVVLLLLLRLLVLRLVRAVCAHRAEPPHQVPRHENVHARDQQQHGRRDGRADNRADRLDVVEVLAQVRGAARHAGAQEHHDRAVPEAEPEADEQRLLAVRDEAARHVVDRRDVVGVDGVPQPERERQDARRRELGVRVRDQRERAQAGGIRQDEQREDGAGPGLERRGWGAA